MGNRLAGQRHREICQRNCRAGHLYPQRYVKSEEKDKANFLYTITAPGNKYFQYHTTFTSMKETFGYKTPEAWFAHLREWKEELAHPVTVKIKDNRTNK